MKSLHPSIRALGLLAALFGGLKGAFANVDLDKIPCVNTAEIKCQPQGFQSAASGAPKDSSPPMPAGSSTEAGLSQKLRETRDLVSSLQSELDFIEEELDIIRSPNQTIAARKKLLEYQQILGEMQDRLIEVEHLPAIVEINRQLGSDNSLLIAHDSSLGRKFFELERLLIALEQFRSATPTNIGSDSQ